MPLVLSLSAERLVYQTGAMGRVRKTKAGLNLKRWFKEDWRTLWQRWPELPAVRDARLIGVDADHLSRPTPRILEGMHLICDAVADR